MEEILKEFVYEVSGQGCRFEEKLQISRVLYFPINGKIEYCKYSVDNYVPKLRT